MSMFDFNMWPSAMREKSEDLSRVGEWLLIDDQTPYSDMWDMGVMHDADYCDMMDYVRATTWKWK